MKVLNAVMRMAAIGALLVVAGPVAAQSAYPSRPIHLISPFSPGVEAKYWHSILAPAGTPKAIIDKMSSEIARILAMPDFREKLLSQGLDPFVSNPDQFAALLKVAMVRYAKIIKDANIKLDN